MTLVRPAEPPVYSECVIGYRRWRLDDWTLRPVTVGAPWRPGVNKAVCRGDELGMFAFRREATPRRHAAPHQLCECGLHALHALSDVASVSRWGIPPLLATAEIVGAVAAWGNIEVHHDGFRAEYAQILALAVPLSGPKPDPGGLALALDTYKVPLVDIQRLADEAHRYGRPLPISARPPKPVDDVYGQLAALGQKLANQIIYGTPVYYVTQPLAISVLSTSTASPSPSRPAPTQPATWGQSWREALDETVQMAKPGDGQVRSAIEYRAKGANRQGPPRPQRAPRKLGPA